MAEAVIELCDQPYKPERRTICIESKFGVVMLFRAPVLSPLAYSRYLHFDGKHGGIHHSTAFLSGDTVSDGLWTG